MRVSYQLGRLRGEKLSKIFIQYHKCTVHKHCKKLCTRNTLGNQRKTHKGKQTKLNERENDQSDEAYLRAIVGSFISKCVQLEAGLRYLSNRTVRRYI